MRAFPVNIQMPLRHLANSKRCDSNVTMTTIRAGTDWRWAVERAHILKTTGIRVETAE